MPRVAIIVFAALSAAACASTLRVSRIDDGSRTGIPVALPRLVQVVTETTYTVVPGVLKEEEEHAAKLCAVPDLSAAIQTVPGDLYYIAVDPARFARTEFSVELTDAGVLRKVSLSSEPGARQPLAGVPGLLGATLPYVAERKTDTTLLAADAGTDTVQKKRDRWCVKMSIRIRLEPLTVETRLSARE